MPAKDLEDDGHFSVPERRPRIVVCGEFGAGKSSVINALIRKPLLPGSIGLEHRPVMTLRHADFDAITCRTHDGRDIRVGAFDQIETVSGVRECLVQTPLPGLAGVEIVEQPHCHDEDAITTMVQADLFIWVTIGSQAWRLSEKNVIQQLPANIRDKSILAISRADKLRGSDDWNKIEDRMQRETSSFFRELVFMQSSNALVSRSSRNPKAWHRTGGSAIADIAMEIIGKAACQTPRPAGDDPAQAVGVAAVHVLKPQADAGVVIPLPPPSDQMARPAAPGTGQVARDDPHEPFLCENPAETRDTREIPELLDGTAGIEAAGIGNFHTLEVLDRFAEGATSAEACTLACGLSLRAQIKSSEFFLPGDLVEEIVISIGKNVFLIRLADRSAGVFGFFLIDREKCNPAIAGMLLRRVIQTWQRERTGSQSARELAGDDGAGCDTGSGKHTGQGP